jgi:hypothetical protein
MELDMKELTLKAVETRALFMGNGIESGCKCYEMICKLQRAYNGLSAIQQGYPDKDEIEDENWEIAVEIFESITGYRIKK